MVRSVQIQGLGGKNVNRNLRFDINAFSVIEDTMKMSVLNALQQPEILARFTTIRTMVWAGLLHEEPSLSISAVGNMIQSYLDEGRTLINLLDKVQAAIAASGLFEKEPGKKEEPSDPPSS